MEVDGIYNLACLASPKHDQSDPVQTMKTSMHGAINVLGLAKRLGVPILQASTSEAYGDGQTRSFCYVDDLVDGLMRLMHTPADVTGPINFGSTKEITVGELAETVVRLTGSKSRIVRGEPPPDDPRRRRPDISKARHTLGWTPTTPLELGLTKTIKYFDELLAQSSPRS